MLLLIAFVFIFIDITLANGMDIVPDAVGFLLLFFYFLKGVRQKETNIWGLLWSLPAAACSVFSYFDTESLFLRIFRFFFLIASTVGLALLAYDLVTKRALDKIHPPCEEELKQSKRILVTALILIAVCELGTPLGALIHDAVNYTLLGFLNFAGIMVIVVTAKMLYLRQY